MRFPKNNRRRRPQNKSQSSELLSGGGQMNKKLAIGGHAWNRQFYYTSGNHFHELSAPGGAAMLCGILGDLAHPVILPDAARREHIQLVKNAVDKKGSGFFAGAHAGWTQGVCTAKLNADGPCVIWDEGLGDIEIPPDKHIFWASKAVLPDRKVIDGANKDKFMLLLDVDVLRKNGAMISRRVSWEHSATDLLWQLHNNPHIQYLSCLKYIVISFCEDGAVYIRRGAGGIKPRLVLTHGGAEGTARGAGGGMPDAWTVIAAGVAAQYYDVIENHKPLLLSPVLKEAANLVKTGYEPDALESGDFARWLPGGLDSREDGNAAIRIPVYDSSLGADPHYWCISGEVQGRKIQDIAFQYVNEGEKAIDGLPRLSIGKLTTVDRKEIEAFQNIKNLITEYASGKAARPLCIAVFGAPGSGKSFGVTQIAQSILPGLAEKLEFNVSQFADAADLSAAFHQVRDVVLKGKLPLVFFDEFDSDREGRPLGWMKSFLMPMQDGKFKDGSGEHPIGKCILVFAGGTSSGLEQFCAPMQSEDSAEVSRFKDVKGPDFVSRLRGAINVLGPNPVNDADQSYILRRALLLRSLCGSKLPMHAGKSPINENVLKAMLLVPVYKHGARSMEAILDMSRIEGARWDPASLPFKTQLSLHVDADVFIRLVLNEVRLESFTEKLAKAAHDDYCRKQAERGETGPYSCAWERLPEEIREDNRRQVRLISKKLGSVGCGFDAGDTPFPSIKKFTEDEIAVLARFEHMMWMAAKGAAGYEYDLRRNDAPLDSDGKPQKLTHPDMVPWEDLSEAAREKDIDTVKNIIPFLKSAGLRVYRTI
jgi:hypothetical protein